MRQSKAQDIARSIGAALSPFIIAAALATAGFWTYQLIWSAPESLSAVTTDPAPEWLAAIKKEAQRQAKAAADAEAKLNAAEAEQQRLKDEVQRQTKAAADADAKRRVAEAEQQRLRDEGQRQTKAAAPPAAPITAPAQSQADADCRQYAQTIKRTCFIRKLAGGDYCDCPAGGAQ